MHSTVWVGSNPLENSTALPLNDSNIRSEYSFSPQENNASHQGLSREKTVWECDNNSYYIIFIMAELVCEEMSLSRSEFCNTDAKMDNVLIDSWQ